MSQVVFKAMHNGEEVIVTGGYDGPLREFFVQVTGGPHGFIMDDLWLRPDERKSTGHARAMLEEVGIEAPEGFWELIELREGNITYTHKKESDGTDNWIDSY